MFDLIDHQNSGPKSELIYEMPMTTWSPYIYNIAYRVKLSDLREGDLIVSTSTCEATSEHQYNVMVCSYIVLTKEKYDVKGQIVSPPYGGNVTRNEHHRPIFSSGSAVVDSNDYRYVSMIVYVASTASKPQDMIKLEKDYGRLYVLQYRRSE